MKYAVVTGSSRGIGSELIKSLAKEGYSVAVCYNSSRDQAVELAKSLAEKGIFVITVKLDLGSKESINEAFSYIHSCFPRIDLLINNGAIDLIKPFEDTSYEEWKRIIDVNLTGTFFSCKQVISEMRENGGSIINVSSIWGDLGASCESAYSASKAGIECFTRSLAKEYPEVLIYAVSLGYVDTDMNRLDEDEIAEFLAEYPFVTRKSAERVAKEILYTLPKAKSGEIIKLW